MPEATKEKEDSTTSAKELYCNMCGTETQQLYLHDKLTMLICAECAGGAKVEDKEEDEEEDVAKAARITTATPTLAQSEFLKSKDSQAKRIAYGVAYPVYLPGESDSQSDTMTPLEIEKAAHAFMIESRQYDLQHMVFDLQPDEAAVVESYIAPVDLTLQDMHGSDKLIRKGSWVVATKFGEHVWESVLKGEYNAYSIRGVGKRTAVMV